MKSQRMNWPTGGFAGARYDWPGTMKHALEPTANRAWVAYEDGYDELREGSLETRFAISNGFLGVRGTRETSRGARWVAPPHTYVGGLSGTLGPQPATPELIPAADRLQIRIFLPSGPLVHHPGDASSHHMTLDVKRGALIGECCLLKAPGVGIRLRTLRVVSLRERAVGLQLIQFEIEDGEIEVTFEASFEGVNLAQGDHRGLATTAAISSGTRPTSCFDARGL